MDVAEEQRRALVNAHGSGAAASTNQWARRRELQACYRILHSTAGTAQLCSAQHRAAQHSAAQRNAAQRSTAHLLAVHLPLVLRHVQQLGLQGAREGDDGVAAVVLRMETAKQRGA